MQMDELNGMDGGAREGGNKGGGGTRTVAQWTAEEVLAWLEANGVGEGVIAAAKTANLDGAMLAEMTGAAWAELGVNSALDQVRLVARAKGAREGSGTKASGVRSGLERLPIQHQSEEPTFLQWTDLDSSMRAYWNGRVPEGGSEHKVNWSIAIANANLDPAEVKQHVLRFLGMYNVIDLLVFTVDTSFLITMESTRAGPNSWSGMLLVLIFGTAAILSGISTLGSCVFYNTCSAVSEVNFSAFCKTPQTSNMLKFINDASIFAGFTTCLFCPLLLIYRCVVELYDDEWIMYPGAEPIEGHWYYGLPCLLLPLYCGWYYFQPFVSGIFNGTQFVMYGGLMADEPIPPVKEDPTWVYRSTPGEIAAWLDEESRRVGASEDPRECEAQGATRYAEDSIARIRESQEMSSEEGVSGEAAPLLSSLAAILSGSHGKLTKRRSPPSASSLLKDV